MAANKRKIQEINAGSMADISFLLLIFFLVATTMNTDSGLARMLPPMPDENTEQKPSDIKERNLMKVLTSFLTVTCTWPEPLHLWQGSEIVLPLP